MSLSNKVAIITGMLIVVMMQKGFLIKFYLLFLLLPYKVQALVLELRQLFFFQNLVHH